MSVFENQNCPVCSKPFKDGDDIVVCPVCGTPCHRGCYKKAGECPNKALHAAGFSYAKSIESAADGGTGQEKAAEQPKKDNAEQGEYVTCEHCGAQIRRGAMFCTKCSARQSRNFSGQYSPDPRLIVPSPDIKYERSSEKIDGVPLADAATVVGSNCDKFMPKFIKHKKINWNWSAFFFGAYYFFYRKMVAQGILVMLLNVIASLVTFTVFSDKIAVINELLSEASTAQEAMALSQSSEYIAAMQGAAPAYIVILCCWVVINILCALFADSIYRRRVVKIVKKADEQIDSGGMFSLGSMQLPKEQINSRDLRRMMLARKGGVSILAPILAYFIFQFLASLLGL
ncbi:MAG: DUF2628 domain-containing protein [Clostridiales bacterium]|nr:DUF2628 domain-containing protein [Clostridiales bacterium]